MAIPAALSSRVVTGRYGLGVIDGPDPDSEPELIPARGTIVFRPVGVKNITLNATGDDPITILLTEFLAVLDDEGFICTPKADGTPGERGLRLFTSNDPASSATGWKWRATPRIITPAGTVAVGAIDPFEFPLPVGTSELNLNKAIPPAGELPVTPDQATALVASAEAAAMEALGAVRRLEQVIEDGLPEGGGGGTPVPGPPNTLSIGTVATVAAGGAATATITGDAPNQTLSLGIPRGAAGGKGDQGNPGPANTLTIGTVTTGAAGSPAAAALRGTAPSQVLDLTIPQGAAGAAATGPKITAGPTEPLSPAVGDIWLDTSA